ncbi:hypothetical protein K1W54_04930 [Micromonospora sp. CPCC 205371]|nr:hypothetical protein [Micromonospora sp. CPCC 205371]
MTGQSTWETVAASGHRPQHLLGFGETDWVRAELARVAVKLRDEHGMTTGVSGMAIGTDLWWAAAVVDAGVKLWAPIPFPHPPDPWRPEDRDEWRRLRRAADVVTLYGDAYDVRLLHARNDGMLAAADAVVAVWKPSKTSGGTASAVRKAQAMGLPIVHLNPERRTVTLLNLARESAGSPSPNPERR